MSALTELPAFDAVAAVSGVEVEYPVIAVMTTLATFGMSVV